MRAVICPACKNKVVASVLQRHALETCPQRMVECERGCGDKVPVSGVPLHLNQVIQTIWMSPLMYSWIL